MFYTIVHYIDEDLLGVAFQQLSKNKAPGIDGETAAEYAEDLQANLRDLHERLTTKQYQANSIKRVWIDKEDGSQRPIGLLVVESGPESRGDIIGTRIRIGFLRFLLRVSSHT